MTQTTRFRFTTRAIEQLKPCPADSNAKAIEYTDTDIPGFKLAVTKAGRKTFSLRYSFREQKRAARIGEFPGISLAEARTIAQEMRALLDRGIDPQEQRDRERASPSFEQFAESYLEYSRQHKRSWKDDESKLRLHLLPRWSRKRICDLSRREVEVFIGEIRQSHAAATANRFLCLISSMYRRAIAWELVERNPCAGVQRFKENNQKQRFLSPEEVGRMLVAMDKDPNQVAVSALRFLLLTGMRRQEALRLRWQDVNLEGRICFIPHTKAGRARYVQLNDSAFELLRDMPTRDVSEWVFASARNPTQPINDPRKTFWRVLAAAGIQDHIRIHDLRHTFASICIGDGRQTLFMAQNLLSHSDPKMTMRYAHISNSGLRDASQAVADVVTRARQDVEAATKQASSPA